MEILEKLFLIIIWKNKTNNKKNRKISQYFTIMIEEEKIIKKKLIN